GVLAEQCTHRMPRLVGGDYALLRLRQLGPLEIRGQRLLDVGDLRRVVPAGAQALAGDLPAERLDVVAAVAGVRPLDEVAGALDGVVDRPRAHLQPELPVVDGEDRAAIVRIRIRDVEVELEASGT